MGHSGATGLDYSVLPFVLKAFKIRKREWGDVFDGIRLMESIALKEMHKEK